MNALSPTRRAQSVGRQAPPNRVPLRRGSDPFYGSPTKKAAYSDLQLYLLACIQEKFVEQPSLLGSDPATPDVPNQPLDIVDSSLMMDSQQSNSVRLLSSSAQEESRTVFKILQSTDSEDPCQIIRDRPQEALDSALFKPPAQDDDLSVTNDTQAVSDEFSTASLSPQLDPQEETEFHTHKFRQCESSSIRPPLFYPESGIDVNSTKMVPVRPGTETRNSMLAVAKPIDEQVTPEFQTVQYTAGIEVNAKPQQRDSGKEIAAAKMRMAEIFNRAKETFARVNSKNVPTNLRTVTPIGAVTSSIKYLVANTTDVMKARHNWNEITEIFRISRFLLPAHVLCQPAPQLGRLSRARGNLETWFDVH
ncbi:uncharacterized protein V1513DRAFT_458022 [Lipomyces chichibuensis]|uniref:uncharacterized protein n=1 Tax=Lipomyces chichibuensis TaxID=1546026 RepID=UPI003343BE6F